MEKTAAEGRRTFCNNEQISGSVVSSTKEDGYGDSIIVVKPKGKSHNTGRKQKTSGPGDQTLIKNRQKRSSRSLKVMYGTAKPAMDPRL